MKFFAGMTNQETAEALGVSDATVERDWTLARAWLISAHAHGRRRQRWPLSEPIAGTRSKTLFHDALALPPRSATAFVAADRR